jgi:lysophospholipase L1-like esterase
MAVIASLTLAACLNDGVPNEGAKLEIRPGQKVVLLGDSITGNVPRWHVEFQNTVTTLATAKGGAAPTYINSGVGGDYVEDMYDRLQAAVLDHEPDVLIIQGGVNDARNAVPAETSAGALADIIDDVRAEFPNVRIMVVGPWADGMAIITATTPTPNPHDAAIDATNAAMRAVAFAKGAAWVDWRQNFKRVTSQAIANTLSPDGVHPSDPVGAAWLAGWVLRETLVRTE